MNKEMEVTTWRSRLFLTLSTEFGQDVDEHRTEVMKRKNETL